MAPGMRAKVVGSMLGMVPQMSVTLNRTVCMKELVVRKWTRSDPLADLYEGFCRAEQFN